MGAIELNQNVIDLASYWSTHPIFDEATRTEIKQLLETGNNVELRERFGSQLEFGTGGIRGIVGAGHSRMNVYIIRRAAYAMIQYLQKLNPKRDLKLAISYDTRKTSFLFAKTCAEVFAAHHATTLITKQARPTPLLSYMVKRYLCDGGVCITASHNPSHYNGFKAYSSYGGQLIPPHDIEVIKIFNECSKYENIPYMDYEKALANNKIIVLSNELDQDYLQRVASLCNRKKEIKNTKIVYTPLHGCGGELMLRSLRQIGFVHCSIVEKQANLDGEFSTLSYANPEDPKSFKLALEQAKCEDADLVMATDPDADRIGVAYKHNSEYLFLTGNEIVALLTDYLLSQQKRSERDLVIKTIVTTDLVQKIAQSYGASVEETLTGFKWICGRVEEYESGKRSPYRQYICGGEESYGFLVDRFVSDKDGISACTLFAEMFDYYRSSGKSMRQILDALAFKHGIYCDELVSHELIGVDGLEKIKTLMCVLRQNPPTQISNLNVICLHDYQKSKSFHYNNKTIESELEFPTSDVLQFILEDGSKVSVRPSGTEPKIKFYFSVFEKAPFVNDEEFCNKKQNTHKRLQTIKNEVLRLIGLLA